MGTERRIDALASARSRAFRSGADLGCSSICSIERCPYGGGRLNPPSTQKKVWGEGRIREEELRDMRGGSSDLLFFPHTSEKVCTLSVDSPRCGLRIVADDVSVSTSIEHGVIGPEARGNFLWNFQKANPGWRCVCSHNTREEKWNGRKKKRKGEPRVGSPIKCCSNGLWDHHSGVAKRKKRSEGDMCERFDPLCCGRGGRRQREV